MDLFLPVIFGFVPLQHLSCKIDNQLPIFCVDAATGVNIDHKILVSYANLISDALLNIAQLFFKSQVVSVAWAFSVGANWACDRPRALLITTTACHGAR